MRIIVHTPFTAGARWRRNVPRGVRFEMPVGHGSPDQYLGTVAFALPEAGVVGILRGVYLHPGGAPVIRSYGYVRNVVRQMVGLMEAEVEKINGKVFYLGDAPRDLRDWVNGFSLVLRGRPVQWCPGRRYALVALAGDFIGKVRGREFLLHSSRYRSMVTCDQVPMSATFESARSGSDFPGCGGGGNRPMASSL